MNRPSEHRSDYFDRMVEDVTQKNTRRYRNQQGPITLHEATSLSRTEWEGLGMSKDTMDTYQHHLREFSSFAHRCLAHPCYLNTIDRFVIARYRMYLQSEKRGIAPRTVQLKLDTVRAFFKVMINLGYCTTNPVAQLEDSKTRRRRIGRKSNEPCVLTPEHVKQLFALKYSGQWGLRDKTLMYTLVFFALRTQEVGNQMWTQLKGHELTFNRLKENDPGVFNIPDFYREMLLEMRRQYGLRADDPIFMSQYRWALGKSGVRRLVRKYGVMIGIPTLCPKDFRTFLVSEISRGTDLKSVQRFIGHLNLETTNHFYQRRTQNEVQQVLDAWVKATTEHDLDEDEE